MIRSLATLATLGSFLSLVGLASLAACSAGSGAGVSNDIEGLGSASGVAGSAQGGAGGSSAGAASGGTGGMLAAAGTPSAGAAGASAGAANGGTAGMLSGGADAAGAPPVLPNVPKPQSPTASWVYIDGYRLMVGKRAADGSLAIPTPFKVKGVSWSPAGIGETNSQGYARLYTSHAAADVPLIAGLKANTVKTYDPFERNAQGMAVLDKLYASGVMVVMQLMASKNTPSADAAAAASYFKGHPAILGWLVGNEFNYNNLYGASNFDQAVALVNDAITKIHAADPDHPVMVGFGEVPSTDNYNRIPGADIWALNLYPALDLNSRFSAWAKLSRKPMFVGEYGADAYNTPRAPKTKPHKLRRRPRSPPRSRSTTAPTRWTPITPCSAAPSTP